MKFKDFAVAMVLVFMLVLLGKYNSLALENQDSIGIMNQQIEDLQQQMEALPSISSDISDITEQIKVLSAKIESNRKELDNKISRGSADVRKMRVTAYDLSVESCGKRPSHPLYGITASGEPVKEWSTIATGPELPFGTRIYIPYFRDKPNNGIFVVADRGSAIKRNCIDVYMADSDACQEFGVKMFDVYVLGEDDEK
ncbi:3D domain protein [Ruminiclostridium hungatei]|uniref:3D domain protein n=1 Tax=Ruminiclostridium hungatei TaxID=48256 RepID=A0A1V4SSZ8_RUMHU|nr:3D domain-containing protein [Ruminiclostridium hungatei]OPX46367.1 3D domain protein [Ruminiclostridium hungatei]